ncbi:MAG: hypothetical protein OEW69_07100 [Nitrospirota bacterium]|nr:hypothetical protein [Nitrospirota bacterium]
MRINERLGFLLILLTIPLYLLLLWFISRQFLGEFYIRKMNEKGLVSAVSYDSKNATYQYLLGRFYQHNSDAFNLDRAISHYRESIRLSPLQGGCWLDLSKAFQAAGRINEAESAMERALRLNQKNPTVMWEAGVFYLVNGNTDKAVKSLKEFILLRPEKQEDAYELLWKLQLSSNYILTNLVPDTYPCYKRYLFYLLSSRRIKESKELWEMMKGLPVEDEVFIRYTDLLISKHIYGEAEEIWKNFIGKRFSGKTEDPPPLIWNGSFEFKILNGGFDWKIGKAKGAQVFLDDDIHVRGGRSLGITFDGKHNPDINIASQVVRVLPKERYFLRGYMRTDNLTTTNGIFFSVEDHDCKSMNKKSEVITGKNFWREVAVEFETPSECNALSINIRRAKSDKLDNKIGGSAWIDGISLIKR